MATNGVNGNHTNGVNGSHTNGSYQRSDDDIVIVRSASPNPNPSKHAQH